MTLTWIGAILALLIAIVADSNPERYPLWVVVTFALVSVCLFALGGILGKDDDA